MEEYKVEDPLKIPLNLIKVEEEEKEARDIKEKKPWSPVEEFGKSRKTMMIMMKFKKYFLINKIDYIAL